MLDLGSPKKKTKSLSYHHPSKPTSWQLHSIMLHSASFSQPLQVLWEPMSPLKAVIHRNPIIPLIASPLGVSKCVS